jgi:hypothetical protein
MNQQVPCIININAVTSGDWTLLDRLVKRVTVEEESSLPHTHHDVRSKLDSRADTICAGKNCRLIHYTGQECTVNGFHTQLGSLEKVLIVKPTNHDRWALFSKIQNTSPSFPREQQFTLIHAIHMITKWVPFHTWCLRVTPHGIHPVQSCPEETRHMIVTPEGPVECVS